MVIFLQNLWVTDIAFFATGKNKIIAYDIPTGPKILIKERFPLSLFLYQKAATLLINLVFIH